MRTLRSFSLIAAFAAALTVAPASQAAEVIFGTEGVFTASGTSTLDLGGGNLLQFFGEGLNLVNADPTSQATFGEFDTSLITSPVNIPIVTGFTLTILQLSPAPTGDPDVVFSGTISGTIRIDNSGAFLQFDGPLSQSIASVIGPVTYSILSGDSFTPGRVNINPSTTNGGRSTIAGLVTVIPEPSSIVLAGLAAPLVLIVRARRSAAKA
ncbi:hypothetical protein [Paludisphaera soli]|uniref:hypothetical protein n=1 Tax=Paludisphaera soli TaxID=2712865 RepID=UPI0013EA2731|nr:hypothetical protein [Paludisphaera soli]